MADVLVASAVATVLRQQWGPFWVSSTTGAIIGCDAFLDVIAWKTTDSGATWTPSSVAVAGTVGHVSCWFDGQEPGNSGGLIHTVWPDDPGGGSTETFKYAQYDIAANTWSTPVNVATGLTTNTSLTTSFIVGTKDGGLRCGLANTINSGAWESTTGATWSAIANPFESHAGDHVMGAWVDTDDDADCGILFWDISADEISVKIHDYSGAAWTETSIAASMVDNTTYRFSSWAAQTKLSNGHVMLAAWNGIDLATADLKTWDLLLDSVGSPTITAKAEVVTDLAESGATGIYIDPVTDYVFCAYLKGGTWNSTNDVFYKRSIDGMATWGTETAYSEGAADNNEMLHGGHATSAGGHFMPSWYDRDDSDIFVNLLNAVGAGVGAARSSSLTLLGVG